jgi:hypothetical protein
MACTAVIRRTARLASARRYRPGILRRHQSQRRCWDPGWIELPARAEPFPYGAVLRLTHRNLGKQSRRLTQMYSIFYIIGVIVVILAVLSLLGIR